MPSQKGSLDLPEEVPREPPRVQPVPSYVSAPGYMMPPAPYPGMYYGAPFAQMMRPPYLSMQQNPGEGEAPQLPPLAIGRDVSPGGGNEEQKMGPGGMSAFGPMMVPFTQDQRHMVFPHQGAMRFPKEQRVQFVTPNFININNVNTLGTALIINNGVPPPPQLQQKTAARQEQDAVFRIEVDQEYYRKLYSERK